MMTTQPVRVQAAIAAQNDVFMQAFARGDAPALAALYTSNGQALPPGGDIATGPQAIQALWQGAMDMGITNARLETIELEQYDDTAIEVGRYTLSAAEKVLDTGKYIVIWKELDGRWRLHRDMWNSSRAGSA